MHECAGTVSKAIAPVHVKTFTMNLKTIFRPLIWCPALLFAVVPSTAQEHKALTPNLPQLLKNHEITTENRTANILFTKDAKIALHLDHQSGPGVAWLNNIRLSTGTIEFDAKGNNTPQGSFLGIAFHKQGNAYDAVYFRPFNFQAATPLSRSHAVQYISYPAYDWSLLRRTHPNQYEAALHPAPDPLSWFHVRCVVKDSTVSVYVNGSDQPSLTVHKLNERTDGIIGFWVGNGSEGDFTNLKVVPD